MPRKVLNTGRSVFWCSIRHAGISRRVGRLKCRWARLKQWWTCTSNINLVGFYPVLQLMRLNCVQQASISTRVNSSIRPPGSSTFVFRYYTRQGSDTVMPGGLCARLCHAFLVNYSSAPMRPACVSSLMTAPARCGVDRDPRTQAKVNASARTSSTYRVRQ